MKKGLNFLLLIPLVFYQSLSAQITLQVFSKTKSQVIEAGSLKKIQISAEKAAIEITTWNQPKIKFDYVIKSKHPDKNIAKEDIEKMKLLSAKSGDVFYIRNYIEIAKNEKKPQSNYEIVYKLTIPKNIKLEISNAFGELVIPLLSSKLSANLKFCTTKIDEIAAECELETNYGKLRLHSIKSETTIESNYTDILIENCNAILNLTANFGSIELINASAFYPIKVKSSKSKMRFVSNLMTAKNTIITTTATDVNLPKEFVKVKENEGKTTWEIKTQATKNILISSNFGTLNYTLK